jgi:hypothetical protein
MKKNLLGNDDYAVKDTNAVKLPLAKITTTDKR